MEDSSYHLVNATELRLSWERSEHASNSRRLTRHAAASNAETIVLSIEKEHCAVLRQLVHCQAVAMRTRDSCLSWNLRVVHGRNLFKAT